MIPNSKIRWTYLLVFFDNTMITDIYFWKNIEQSLLIMYVFQISRKNVDYGSGQIKYTLLQAKAINKISEEEEVWYKNPAYKE